MSPIRTAPAPLAADDAARRSQYMDEVLRILYPEPCVAGPPGSGNSTVVTEFIVIPDARRPRLLVPAGSRRVAAAAVRRYAEPQSRLARLKRDAVVAALRTGASTVLLRDRIRVTGGAPGADTIEAYLRDALGADLTVSVHIGPARANRKPVLQLLARTGATIGFAKLGTGPLTRRLVRAETAALTALAHVRLRQLTVPKVLHAGRWQGHQVLVQQALPTWRTRSPLGPDRLAVAMREVAACCGTTGGWLSTSPYWAELRNRLADISDHAEGSQLGAAARKLHARAGDVSLRYGAWHGDWSPWNMAVLADELLVWDWERFTPGVPLGLDALHHDLQRRLQRTPDAGAAVDETVRRAPILLAPFEVAPHAAEVTALLYLVDLAARYVADRQAEAGARLGVLGSWLLPVLIRRVEAL
ncbi:MAG TPA: hypothetical protein VFE14_12675 [Micromonosporaceae bacterium]|jgi:hypothetical protein|nr:hypothetical protein [Micromonosporaceae bacterium]